MDTRAFGFAKPIAMDAVRPGDLLAVELAEGERVIGVAFATDHDNGLIAFWSNRDGEVPRTVDYGEMRRSLGKIDGVLEIEPDNLADAFRPSPKKADRACFVIDENGKIGLWIDVAFFESPTRTHIDLSTGKAVTKRVSISPLSDVKLQIRQDGREKPFPLLDLVP